MDARSELNRVLWSIPAWILLEQRLATSGQPNEEQLQAVARAGFEQVINLGLRDPAYALPDEEATVRGLGMDYVHIPVAFNRPLHEDLLAFGAAMRGQEGRSILVHCRHNKRVPVFIALHRIMNQGWEKASALSVMRATWEPDEVWQRFIREELEMHERNSAP